jgi:hypothetical protein
MTDLVKVEKRTVLEPTEVLPPKKEVTYGDLTEVTIRHGRELAREYFKASWPIEGEVVSSKIPQIRSWNPFPEQRALGYTRNPDTCRHEKKGYTPRDGWWCRDCGDTL